MKTHNLSQILVLVLAVAISLYFWLGGYAYIVYGAVVVVVVSIYLLRGRTRVKKDVERKPTIVKSSELKELSIKIEAKRKEQGRKLVAVAEQIKALNPKYNRLIERLLDWYLEYLSDNGIYHQDLYQYLLVRIKDRQKEAKAHYLKRELELSKILIRAIMRGEDAYKIVERLEIVEDEDSQER
ncbi:MAG: hypothetical protein IJW88_03995 [Alistipes sp.]|nr:hypothetical protein [Alistipes sp.]